MRLSLKKCVFGSSLLALSACRTSGDLATGRDDRYVDPTEVKTIDAPPAQTPASQMSAEQLQAELAVTRGELENVKYSTTKEQDQLRQRIAELENANQRLAQENSQLRGGGSGSIPGALSSGTSSTGGAMSPVVTAPPEGTSSRGQRPIEVHGAMPEKSGAPLLWDLAQEDLKAGRYQKAISPLSELSKSYPKDPLALYALLGTGMAQYRLKQYSDAAVTFNQVIDKYPKKKETGMAWFGQAAAFVAMKQEDDAKVLLEEVARRYPRATEGKVAKRMLKKSEKAPSDLFAVFPGWDKKATR